MSAATITVTTTADDLTPNDGSVSLREAMTAMNTGSALGDPDILAQNPTASGAFGTGDLILFAIPGAGTHTIALASPLPPITHQTAIDGYSQPGSLQNTSATGDNAVIDVVVDGGGSVANGLQISGSGSTIRGLSMIRFTNTAIAIVDGGSNLIVGNFIGVGPDGVTEAAGAFGVSISGVTTAASLNLIGNGSPATRNLIAGTQSSVLIAKNPMVASGNHVMGNLIGSDRTGMVALPALGIGIHLIGTTNTQIGSGLAVPSSCSGNCNVIVAGTQPGIQVDGPGVGSNPLANIQSNFIGTNVTGTAALGGTDEILVNTAATTVNIESNLISGGHNSGAGIRISNATGSLIDGNRIGTNATGTAAIANGGPGIVLTNSAGFSIFTNVISGNRGAGIDLEGTTNISITTNDIGVGADGTTPIGNGGAGIALGLTQAANGTQIGITGGTSEPNVIGNNGGAGVLVQSGTANRITTNSIYRNGGIGIDLGGDGPTPNDACDADTGANNLQNTPVITSVQMTPSPLISGTLNSAPNTTYRVEFFSTPLSGGFEQGQTYLGFTLVHTAADCTGTFAFAQQSLPAGSVITATATDPAGNTSEFSGAVLVTPPNGVPALSDLALLLLALAMAMVALAALRR